MQQLTIVNFLSCVWDLTNGKLKEQCFHQILLKKVSHNHFVFVDYDECVANFDNCDENAECINTDGGFDCVCNEGYTGDGFTCTRKQNHEKNVV